MLNNMEVNKMAYKNFRTLAIDEELRQQLKELREHPRETYGDILRKLIKSWNGGRK